MQSSSIPSIFARPAPGTGASAAIPNPQLDPLVAAQARFRVEGSGPVASRRIVPATEGARELVAASAAVTDTVRGVLRLVEHAAGGAASSSRLVLNGVALANSPRGHGANGWRAHMDDDAVFHAGLAKVAPAGRAAHVARLGDETLAATIDTKANVIAGWMNIGPEASGALLSHAGVVIPRYNEAVDEAALAQAVRVLRHEAQHLADPTAPELDPAGALGLREALAEAHSTSLGHLRPARRILGLDDAVDDAALASATQLRPYAAAEQLLAGSMRAAGIDGAGAGARRLLARPASEVAETLVARVAQASRTQQSEARSALSREFARAIGGRG